MSLDEAESHKKSHHPKGVNSIHAALIGLVGGIVGALLTYGLPYLNKDRELNLRFAELAISILSKEIDENSYQSRLFAIQLLSQSTGVEIEVGDMQAWAETGTLAIDPNILFPRFVYVPSANEWSSITVAPGQTMSDVLDEMENNETGDN